MPRPLNWVKGEGTSKLQRWGLSGLGDVPLTGAPCPGTPGCPGYVAPGEFLDIQGQLADLWDSVFSLQEAGVEEGIPSVHNATVGEWINRNKTMLLVGGVVGLLLFSRR